MLRGLLIQWGVPAFYVGSIMIVVKILGMIVLCWGGNLIARNYLVRFLKVIVRKTKNRWDDIFLDNHVFDNLSLIVPALAVYFLAPLWFETSQEVVDIIKRLASAYMIMIGCLVLDATLNAVLSIYQRYDISRRKPIKGYVQAIKIVVYFFTILFVISVLMNKSLWGFLSIFGGLTAMTMLVFKDVILGLVAGVQLTSNNMVARGDWIEMPKYGADGDVVDVTLTSVMVRNWDKTITTIPTYALISDSFKNWRGMEESGGRRIKRPIFIDMNSIKFVDDNLLKKFEKYEYLKDYLAQKTKNITDFNRDKNIDTSELINGRRLTNVGTFRAYVVNYLRNHPKIHQGMTFLIRHLAPGENGLPIEIYVFSNDQVWANYEAIQADIFDHILAVIPEFGLRIFQNPTGLDFQKLVVRSS